MKAKSEEPSPREDRVLYSRHKRLQYDALIDYVNYLRRPRWIFWTNFYAGLARGIGAILGGTVLIALLLLILAWLANIPVVGEYFRWLAESIHRPG